MEEPFEINQTQNALMREDFLENFMNRNQINKNTIPNHPVAKMQYEQFKKDEMNKMRRYSDLYGTGYAFQLCLERNALANMKRDFPLKSNNFALNIACGNYDKIEFRDYLGKDKPFDVDQSLFRQCEKVYLYNN